MKTLDLTKGLGDFEDYKAWKFPGGELHFKNKGFKERFAIEIKTRINSSDDLILLMLAVDGLGRDNVGILKIFIPYFPYQQADRDFGGGECFSLKVITQILNTLGTTIEVFDPHSDVTPALLRYCEVIDNSEYIDWVRFQIGEGDKKKLDDTLVWLSPDAGAYKKIFKLAEKIGFKGEILCCQKNRDTDTGEVEVVVPSLPKKDVLIIDDICVGGRTFIEIAKKIHLPPEYSRYLAISHGIFSNGFTELSHYFNKIYTTSSRRDNYGDNLVQTYKII